MIKIDLGQALSILSNVGVIAGILLLAYELNQNQRMMEAQTRHAISETLINIQLAEGASPELRAINVKAMTGEPLTPVEQEGFRALWTATFRYWENVHYQHRIGLYDDDEYFAQREAWRGILSSSSLVRDFWCSRAKIQSPQLVLELQELMEESAC